MNIKDFLDQIFGIFTQNQDQELLSPIPQEDTTKKSTGGVNYRHFTNREEFEKAKAEVLGVQDTQNQPQAAPSEALAPYMFDATPYGKQIPQPPADIAEILREYFPEDATRSAIAAQTESGYNPEATNVNKNGSVDTGLFQINSDTFKDFMQRKGHILEQYGINSYNQMKNPIFNAAMAKIIEDEQGWNAWYGPKNKNYKMGTKI